MDDTPTRRRLLQAGGGLGALALAGCSELPSMPWESSAPDSWPTYRYDAANTGAHSGAGPGGSMAIKWEADLESFDPSVGPTPTTPSGVDRTIPSNTNVSPPIVVDDTVYVSMSGVDPLVGLYLVALDADSGSIEWRSRAREPFAGSGRQLIQPTYVDGTVIVPGYPILSDVDPVVAFDAATGEEQWRYGGTGRPSTSGAVLDDQIVFAGGTAVSVGTEGDAGWEFDATGAGGDLLMRSRGQRPPAAGNDTVYVPAMDRLYAVDATGEKQWSRTLDFSVEYGLISLSTFPYSPVVGDGTVYVVTGYHQGGPGDGRLLALDPADGSTRWEFKPSFEPERRQQLWEEFYNEAAGVYPRLDVGVYTTPALWNGTLYVPGYTLPESDEPQSVPRLFAVDAESGEQQWSSPLDGTFQVPSGPVVADGIVYLVSEPGILVFDGETGKRLGTIPLDTPPRRLTVVGDTIYTSDGGALYAIGPAEGTTGTPSEGPATDHPDPTGSPAG